MVEILVSRGGKRPGAGRPKGEPTTRITVKVSLWEKFKEWLTEQTKVKHE